MFTDCTLVFNLDTQLSNKSIQGWLINVSQIHSPLYTLIQTGLVQIFLLPHLVLLEATASKLVSSAPVFPISNSFFTMHPCFPKTKGSKPPLVPQHVKNEFKLLGDTSSFLHKMTPIPCVSPFSFCTNTADGGVTPAFDSPRAYWAHSCLCPCPWCPLS